MRLNNKNPNTDPTKSGLFCNLDSSLFLVKHLLILREQVTSFECDLVTKEKFLDFSNFFGSFKEVFGSSGGESGPENFMDEGQSINCSMLTSILDYHLSISDSNKSRRSSKIIDQP